MNFSTLLIVLLSFAVTVVHSSPRVTPVNEKILSAARGEKTGLFPHYDIHDSLPSLLTTTRQTEVNPTSPEAGSEVKSPLFPAFCQLGAVMSRCAEERVAFVNGEKWCSFHICKPSLVMSDECPSSLDEEPATHHCKARFVTVTRLVCKAGRLPKGVTHWREGCVGNDCQGVVLACACEWKTFEAFEVESATLFTPNCNTEGI